MSRLTPEDLQPHLDEATLSQGAKHLCELGVARLSAPLSGTIAQALAREMADLPWLTSGWLGDRFVNADAEELARIGPDRFAAFAAAGAESDFRVLHDVVHVDRTDAERRSRDLVIDRLARAWASLAALEQWNRLLGTDRIENVQMLGSRYQPGHFLTPHDDTSDGRAAAFVLSLSEDWQPHWGGQLHVDDNSGRTQVLTPQFGTLTVFTVPRAHFVSQVASYAPRARLSVAGWFLQG